jgi:peptidoglycan hydrolase-like protein with peptidoglycan-binding domain
MVELIGKWARVPYWKCLAVDQAHPEFQRELSDWHSRLPAAQRIKVMQAGLAHAGYYRGPVDGRETLELREAIAQFQADKSIAPTGTATFQVYEVLVRDYVVVDSDGRFVRAEWLKALHEGSRPNFRLGAGQPSESGLAPQQAPERPLPLSVNVMPSRPDRTYRVGDLIDLAVSVSRGSYLRCYLQDVERRVAQIYPNRFQTNDFVPARRAVRIPGDAGVSGFVLEFEKEGVERVLCLASDSDLSVAMPAAWKLSSLSPIAGLRSLDPIEQFAVNALGPGRVGIATIELRARK